MLGVLLPNCTTLNRSQLFSPDLINTHKQAVSVRTIRLVGAQDAEEAFDNFQRDYCRALVDSQFADIGVSCARTEWQVLLAQPVLDSHMGDGRTESKALLAEVNTARARLTEHRTNLMNPMFTQMGAAYATDARSDEGVYWTMLFGAP